MLMCSLRGGSPLTASLQSRPSCTSSASATMLASNSFSDMASTRAQSVRLSPRVIIALISSVECRTVLLRFAIARSPHGDNSDDGVPPRPHDSERSPVQFADADPTLLGAARRRNRVEWPAIEQCRRIDEINPAFLQDGETLSF